MDSIDKIYLWVFKLLGSIVWVFLSMDFLRLLSTNMEVIRSLGYVLAPSITMALLIVAWKKLDFWAKVIGFSNIIYIFWMLYIMVKLGAVLRNF